MRYFGNLLNKSLPNDFFTKMSLNITHIKKLKLNSCGKVRKNQLDFAQHCCRLKTRGSHFLGVQAKVFCRKTCSKCYGGQNFCIHVFVVIFEK